MCELLSELVEYYSEKVVVLFKIVKGIIIEIAKMLSPIFIED